MIAFPNPARPGHVTFSYVAKETGSLTLRIWTYSGSGAAQSAVVPVTAGAGVSFPVDLHSLAPGLYYYQCVIESAGTVVRRTPIYTLLLK